MALFWGFWEVINWYFLYVVLNTDLICTQWSMHVLFFFCLLMDLLFIYKSILDSLMLIEYLFLWSESLVYGFSCCCDRDPVPRSRFPQQSRSISQSLSPHDERVFKSNQRSPSSRENGQSLHHERDYVPSRSRSPRGISRSPSRSRSRSFR